MNLVVVIIKDKEMFQELLYKTDWTFLKCRVAATADNATDGIIKVRQILPALVITENKLPDLTGMEMISYLKTQNYTGKFIVISSERVFEEVLLALRLGVLDFLVKPLNHKELETAVRRLEINGTGKTCSVRSGSSLDSKIYDLRHRGGKSCRIIRKALVYIDTHLFTELSLTVLCDFLSLSPSYFSRLFKKEVGIGFLYYVQMVKMSEAERLLQNPKIKAWKVAELLGYRNYTYFFRIYKKYHGKSPRSK